jgi:hypothetical protein
MYIFTFVNVDISNLITVVKTPLFVSCSSSLMMAILLQSKHVALLLMSICRVDRFKHLLNKLNFYEVKLSVKFLHHTSFEVITLQ